MFLWLFFGGVTTHMGVYYFFLIFFYVIYDAVAGRVSAVVYKTHTRVLLLADVTY